jgi:four helix bundle protein
MDHASWLASVPAEITGDPLWKMAVYRLATFAGDLAWRDLCKLATNRRMIGLSDQLYRAVGSIAANLAEGYSRQSGKDQSRFYEYALGSAREARHWYYQGRHVLSSPVSTHRMRLLTQIVRHLLAIVPAQRGYRLREDTDPYSSVPADLLDDPPMP